MRRLLGMILALLTVAGCGTVVGARAESPVGEQVLPPSTHSFATDRLVWAKGSKIHDGGDVYSVAPYQVNWMQRTPHGFFVDLVQDFRGSTGSRAAWFDGAKITWLPRQAQHPKVSPDGRLAGWLDFAGPRIKYGRSARVQIVDLVTGKRVWSTSRWMGDNADVYGDVAPDFLGFDDTHAYWRRVEGKVQLMRTDLATWRTSVGATISEDFWEVPKGNPLNPYTGTEVVLDHGRPDPTWTATEGGFLSADGRFAFGTSATGRLKVFDAATGARIDPDWGGKWRIFVGWRDADTFYAALPARFLWSYDPNRPDRIRVRLAACDLPSGRCSTVRRVRGLTRLVVGTGAGPY